MQSSPAAARPSRRRSRGRWLVVAAVLSYLLVPALYAAHVAFVTDDDDAAAVALPSSSDRPADSPADGGSRPWHMHDESHCSICHLLGAVGGAGDPAAFAPLVVTSAAVQAAAFSPRAFCLPSDPQSKPAAPRAPPAC